MHPENAALYAKIDLYEEALIDILEEKSFEDVQDVARLALATSLDIPRRGPDGKKKV